MKKIKRQIKFTPLMMMRTKGMTGPFITNHKSVKGKSKSVGNTIGDQYPP